MLRGGVCACSAGEVCVLDWFSHISVLKPPGPWRALLLERLAESGCSIQVPSPPQSTSIKEPYVSNQVIFGVSLKGSWYRSPCKGSLKSQRYSPYMALYPPQRRAPVKDFRPRHKSSQKYIDPGSHGSQSSGAAGKFAEATAGG